MTLASKQAILESFDSEYKDVEVPKWGTLRIRSLTAKERLDLVSFFGSGEVANEQAVEFFCKLIAMSAVDEAGKQLFDLNGDIERLKNKSWDRLRDVANQIMEFNAMGKTGQEQVEKN